MPALRFIHEDGQRYIDEYECKKSPGRTLRKWRHKHLAHVSNPGNGAQSQKQESVY